MYRSRGYVHCFRVAGSHQLRSSHFTNLHACRSVTNGPDAEQLAAHAEAQKRLQQMSSETMMVNYCRDYSSSKFARYVRSISIDVNYDFRRWRKHQGPNRHVGLWTPKNIIRADAIRRLLWPDLAVTGAISSLLVYYNAFWCCKAADATVTIQHGFNTYLHEAMLTLPLECFSITSMALGLLVTFKTQTAYSRFTEGRSLWGLLINESRAYSSRILARVPSASGSKSAEVMCARMAAVKLVRSFCITLKYHLTEDGCNPHIYIGSTMPESEIKAVTAQALKAELYQIWDIQDLHENAFVERILSAEVANRPLHVLHELQHLNATVFAHPSKGRLDDVAATELDRSLTTFHNVLGACEKILRTPIYSPYTRFTNRFLSFWCNSLPFAVYPIVGPIGTVPTTLVIAFFMLGIEDIGSRVEQPFDVLPLWQYCQTIDSSCLQLVRHSEQLTLCGVPAKKPTLQPVMASSVDEEEYLKDVKSKSLKSYIDPMQYELDFEDDTSELIPTSTNSK